MISLRGKRALVTGGSRGIGAATALLQHDSTRRECALDLLSVDALVTYAMEAAAEDPDTFASRVHDAMDRLAAAAQ